MIISIIASIIAIVLLAYVINKSVPPSSCNGDCNQGRNCTCGAKD